MMCYVCFFSCLNSSYLLLGLTGSQRSLTFYYSASHQRLVIRKPDINVGEDFDLVIA